MMTMQLSSHNNENRKSLRASSPLRDIEENTARVVHERRRRSKVRRKKVRAHSRVRLPLEMERLLSPKHFLAVMRVRY